MRREVLILDNDVLVNIFDTLYSNDREMFKRVIEYFLLNYYQLWIPKIVRHEFLIKRNDKKRSRRLTKIMSDYQAIINCPVSVGKNEIIILNGIEEDNAGEAEAILQGTKAKTRDDIAFSNILLMTNDKGAIKRAENMSLSTVKYNSIKETLLEVGIIMP